MSGGFPIGLEIFNGQSVGSVPTTSGGTVISSSSTANVKGSWTELINSTYYDSVFMLVHLYYNGPGNYEGTQDTGSLDIAIGPSGSEQVIINNLVSVNPVGTWINGSVYNFPISIKAGTRISARSQTGQVSSAMMVSISLFDGAFTQTEGCAGVDSLGFQSNLSYGTTITGNTTANIKGSFSQLIGTTTHDYIGLLAGYDNNNAATAASGFCLLDIAIGASGLENIIIPNLFLVRATLASYVFHPTNMPFIPISIPSGTRISARIQSSNASEILGLTLYGVYQ